MLHTGNRFVGGFASDEALSPAKECAGSMSRRSAQVARCSVSLLRPSAMPLRYPLLSPVGDHGFRLDFSLCGFKQAGRRKTKTEIGTKTAMMRMKTTRKRTERMAMVNKDEDLERVKQKGSRWINPSLAFTTIRVLARTRRLLLISHCPAFLSRVRDRRIFLAETDRLNYIGFHQENLRLHTAHDITDARCQQRLDPRLNWAFGTLGSTFKNSPSEITQLYQDAMACTVQYGKPLLFFTATCNPDWLEIKAARGPNDKTCNRLDLKCTSV
ncbi:BZ3500_MvSof-1268-A1-R1_Chr8-1g09929 [Microbotryum saponariae]|uniref:BZ3500_MvSof-1268-A1-R1_Chr8-1g09929 protein n=1 Tax=Microbotryum saponariae TaxID=289078 RepID=A0A2X0KUG6_9BASI|nr:BZ3500_MvSof-1268-A1-R1_Chr8-1g09929 [Microbotryum saponariae]SDA08215.1 BZ3501_MvSof-1269-A2-R1_Chr8-1g09652 [Microbotryum saponariae]